jgi:hypothetical protein
MDFYKAIKISEPTPRIQGENHYLFGVPSRNPAGARGSLGNYLLPLLFPELIAPLALFLGTLL